MAYSKKTWMDGDLINASDLNNIENGIENVTNQTRIVEQEFKSLQVGDKMPMVFTKEMLSDPTVITAQYGISEPGADAIDGYFWFDPDSTFGLGGWSGDVIGALGIYDEETETLTIDLTQADISNNIIRSVNTNFGPGLIGNKIDKQLTAQEAYDELKQTIVKTDVYLGILNYNASLGGWSGSLNFVTLENKYIHIEIFNETSGVTEGTIIAKSLNNRMCVIPCFSYNKGYSYNLPIQFFVSDTGTLQFIAHLGDNQLGEVSPYDLELRVYQL